MTTVAAITDLVLCPAPLPSQAGADDGLAEAYAVSNALDQQYLCLHIVRLGRLNAMERIADWLLELRERLNLSGEAPDDSFILPVTQEIIADALGLTSVHVNRTLQAMRRDGLLELRGGAVTLLDVAQLTALADYRPPRIAAR